MELARYNVSTEQWRMWLREEGSAKTQERYKQFMNMNMHSLQSQVACQAQLRQKECTKKYQTICVETE